MKVLPDDVEIIVVGNNSDPYELDVAVPDRIKFIKFNESMLYSRTVNAGVSISKGEIVTLCDQDVFGFTDWYTPLLNKLLSDKHIGSVSSKLLNPSNERIIDFGIEYANCKIVHPFRGHLSSYPPALKDRVVTSTTSATLMLRKSLYEKVGGMDPDMPYCCSDCDIGIKIRELGYENWVVADSVAYHKGSSSTTNGKSMSFSHLSMHSHNMFWAKNYKKVTSTIQRYLQINYDWWSKTHSNESICIFVNLSGVYDYRWYADQFSRLSGCEFADYYSYKSGQSHYREPIQLYDILPYSFMSINAPMVYLVDYFPSLQINAIWSKMRNTTEDIVMDIHGNIVMLNDNIQGRC